MYEQELVDLTEYFQDGGHALDVRRRQGWCLVAAVWDARGEKLIGCLRLESIGQGDAPGELAMDLDAGTADLAVAVAA